MSRQLGMKDFTGLCSPLRGCRPVPPAHPGTSEISVSMSPGRMVYGFAFGSGSTSARGPDPLGLSSSPQPCVGSGLTRLSSFLFSPGS